MNKFINILLLLIAFPTMVLSIFVGFDLPIEFLKTSGQQLPYRFEAFLVLGIIFFVVIIRRSVQRWTGIKMVAQKAKYKWNVAMGKERKKYVYLYQYLEAFTMLIVGVAFYILSKDAIVPALALVFGFLDNVLFAILGQSKNIYRVGLTTKAVVVADRDVKVLYLSGLRQVSVHQQSIYFDYIKDLQLHFPLNCIPEADQSNFVQELKAIVNEDKVFFSESVRNLVR